MLTGRPILISNYLNYLLRLRPVLVGLLGLAMTFLPSSFARGSQSGLEAMPTPSILDKTTSVVASTSHSATISIATTRDAELIAASSDVIIFFSPSCPICCEYFPEIEKLAHQYSSKDKSFWLVMESDQESIRQFVNQYHPSERILADAEGLVQARLKATVTPEVVVFEYGKEVYRGRIDDRYVRIGQRRQTATSNDLERVLADLSKGTRVSQRHTVAVGCFLEAPETKRFEKR